MNDMEIRAQQLREELRNERNRNRTNERDRGVGQGSGSTDVAFRPNRQDAGTDTREARTNAREFDDNDRGVESKPKRGRQNRRRHEHDGTSLAEGSSQAAIIGLTRDDLPEIEQAPPTASTRGRKIKDTAQAVKQTIFKKKTVLTEKEAKEYYEPLIRSIQSYGEYADMYLDWKVQGLQRPIWGNLTDTEAGALAKIMIRRGLKNAEAAEMVRNMINGEDYVTVGVMFIPRIYWTVQELRNAPKRGRKR